MNKLIEDWIVNEMLDTLRQARISLLGITALDSPLELERKTKENSTAITRRIEKVLDLIDPSKLSTDWSEEDELMRSAVLNTLDRIGDVGTIGMQKNWLKSFPHSTPTKEQPVDWQKVAEAHAKDQPLGQDNDGNLVYLQEQPVCEDVEMEIKETELEYQQRSERGEYPASIESICRRFYELGRQSKQTEWTEKDKSILDNIVAYKYLNVDDLEWLKDIPNRIQQSKPEVSERLYDFMKKRSESLYFHDDFEIAAYKKGVVDGAKWQKEQMMKDGLDAVKSGQFNKIEKTIAGVFVKYGMDRQKEQMMKEAREGYVTLTLTGVRTVAATIKEEDNIGLGDEVRVIVCKKED